MQHNLTNNVGIWPVTELKLSLRLVNWTSKPGQY